MPRFDLADTSTLAAAVCTGNRRALARALTLVESRRADHRERAAALLSEVAPRTGGALRIGLSGTPGVGKSTFIEAFGTELTARGHRVAVLAVDPSSTVTGGSVLGDKTRMTNLVRNPAAYIRPSASGGTLGGVALRTRESIALCEAAGFDVVIVETVGVGQSEVAVSRMTDVFLLLLAPAGGDELQGVKRGIMEIADLIVVNKADGTLKPVAERTRADYGSALRLLRRREGDAPDFPMAVTASALEGDGVGQVADLLARLDGHRRQSGLRDGRRQAQALDWLDAAFDMRLKALVAEALGTDGALDAVRAAVARGELTAEAGAERLVDALRGALRAS